MMDDILFGPEIWGEDSIHSNVWYILDDSSTENNYNDLIKRQEHYTWDYLRMIQKLLPYGHIWNFPIGEPGDY